MHLLSKIQIAHFSPLNLKFCNFEYLIDNFSVTSFWYEICFMYFPEKAASRNKNNSTCYLCDTQCSSQILLAFHFERKHPGKKPYRFDLIFKSGIRTKAELWLMIKIGFYPYLHTSNQNFQQIRQKLGHIFKK